MTDVRVLAFVNHVAATSFESELSLKIDATTDVEVVLASLYDDDRSDVELADGLGDTTFVPLGAEGRFDVSAYRRLRSVAAECDVLHTHYNLSGSIARTVCAPLDVAIVDTEHADHRYYSLPQRLVNVPSFAFADEVVFNSENTRDSLAWYERLWIDDAATRVIYNGIDMPRIERARSRPGPELPDGRVVLSACRMIPVKNLDTLIRAVARLAEELPDVALVLVGDGPERGSLEEVSDDQGVADRVWFPGYLDREDVYAAMHRADLFAVPSFREGFCNAAVEAMGCGLPVVASDIPVLHEVVGDGGRYADPEDPADVAGTIGTLLEEPELRRQVGDRAASRARETFPIERSVEAYVEVYRSLVGEDGR